MTVEIGVAFPDDVEAVAQNMRHRDFVEFSALSPADGRTDLANILVERYGRGAEVMVARWDGRPIAIGGLFCYRPNVASILFLATDNFPRVALSVTRFISKELFPRYEEIGVHRFEAISMLEHDEAHRWLATLGLKKEAVFFDYGKNRETFVQFAKVVDAGPLGD